MLWASLTVKICSGCQHFKYKNWILAKREKNEPFEKTRIDDHRNDTWSIQSSTLTETQWPLKRILIHYVYNAHFHWLWRRKFAALKSLRLCHESSDDVTSLATRRSNVTKTFWKNVLSEWIRMVITRFVLEWFAGINCIILRSQIPVLPLR